ncbi:MAG TPA: hypothetical protein VIH57_12160 [Bacteroidales bacterium]
MRKLLLLTLLIIPLHVYKSVAQDNTEKPVIKVGGYIRTETFYDTYRSVESRDGESYNYPVKRGLDAAGNDTNRINQFTMLSLQSRFKISASGVSAFGAKVSSLIEADFLGMGDDSKFMVGLRHAYARLDWNKTQLLLGQTWTLMSISEFAANTVLFASGTTFQPQIRAAQARLTYQLADKLKLSGAIMGYTTHHPIEPKGNNSQRNSGLPAIDAQFQYGSINNLFFALTYGYQFLKPYLTTSAGTARYEATKIVSSYHLQACLGYKLPIMTLKVQGNLTQNFTNAGLIGGYLPVEGSVNAKGEYDYANITVVTTWFDVESTGNKFKPGLFIGYAENLGTNKNVIASKPYTSDLCRNSDIRSLLRIAPRFYYISGPVDIGVEYIRNSAVYGTFRKQSVKDAQDPTVNNRFLVSVRYTF